jgi:hypothetical protein
VFSYSCMWSHSMDSMRPQIAIYVSSYCYICVLIRLIAWTRWGRKSGRQETACQAGRFVILYFYICVLILLHICPHTTTYGSPRDGMSSWQLRRSSAACVCALADMPSLGNPYVAVWGHMCSSMRTDMQQLRRSSYCCMCMRIRWRDIATLGALASSQNFSL